MVTRDSKDSSIGRVRITNSGKVVVECKNSGYFYLYDRSGVYTGESWSEIEFEEYQHLILKKN